MRTERCCKRHKLNKNMHAYFCNKCRFHHCDIITKSLKNISISSRLFREQYLFILFRNNENNYISKSLLKIYFPGERYWPNHFMSLNESFTLLFQSVNVMLYKLNVIFLSREDWLARPSSFFLSTHVCSITVDRSKLLDLVQRLRLIRI